MVFFTKTKLAAINVLLVVLVALFFYYADSNSSYEDKCYGEVDSLYESAFDLQHKSEITYSDKNWMYILSIMKKIENNTKWENNYQEDGREKRDLAAVYESNLFDLHRNITIKKFECRTFSEKADKWRSKAFIMIIIQFILSIIYLSRTQWKRKSSEEGS